jgi:hypothetical protein
MKERATQVLLFGDIAACREVHEKDDDGVQRLDDTCDEPDQVR